MKTDGQMEVGSMAKDWLSKLSEEDLEQSLDADIRALLSCAGRTEEDIERVAQVIAARPPHLAARRRKRIAADYWRSVKEEVYLLLCTDDAKYSALLGRLTTTGRVTGPVVIAMIATAVSKELGFGTTLITPFVVLCLIAVVRVGTQAWCRLASNSNERGNRARAPA